jgi:protein tyrosine phosphatase
MRGFFICAKKKETNMASQISLSLTPSASTTQFYQGLNDWLMKRIEPANISCFNQIFAKNIKELTSTEIEKLWYSLINPDLTSQLICEDQKFDYVKLDSTISTVDCILLNSVTAITTTIGPLNASVIWDLAKPTLPPDLQSNTYWGFANALKETLNNPGAQPVICAQLPHEQTRGTYWRMVFEKNVGTLFSLTSARDCMKQIGSGYSSSSVPIEPLQEGRAADEFWPLLGETSLFKETEIEVKQVAYSGPPPSSLKAEFKVCEFILTDLKTSGQKTVRMIRYQSWGDGSSPNTHHDIQEFSNLLKTLQLPGGICLNCRASVGRSGTLAAYFILDSLRQAGIPLTIHLILKVVEVIRKNRNFQMIQTQTQWSTLIHALAL